jgi:hypothetical protein
MRSRTLLPIVAAAIAAPLIFGADGPKTPGGKLPEFDAVKWYNTVPISAADLQDKAVLIEVFRTW